MENSRQSRSGFPSRVHLAHSVLGPNQVVHGHRLALHLANGLSFGVVHLALNRWDASFLWGSFWHGSWLMCLVKRELPQMSRTSPLP